MPTHTDKERAKNKRKVASNGNKPKPKNNLGMRLKKATAIGVDRLTGPMLAQAPRDWNQVRHEFVFRTS